MNELIAVGVGTVAAAIFVIGGGNAVAPNAKPLPASELYSYADA